MGIKRSYQITLFNVTSLGTSNLNATDMFGGPVQAPNIETLRITNGRTKILMAQGRALQLVAENVKASLDITSILFFDFDSVLTLVLIEIYANLVDALPLLEQP